MTLAQAQWPLHGAFLFDLAVVLCAAAVTSLVFHRLRLPVVLGYLLAGMLVGPHCPLPPEVDVEAVRQLSELGVILLMFSVGLEFSVPKVIDLGSSATIIAVVEVAVVCWLGYVSGRAFGWDLEQSVFLGVGLSIASTMVIGKSLIDGRRDGLRELVLGIVVVEDLISVFLLALLTAVAAGVGLSVREFALTSANLLFFLTLLMVGGAALVPRFMRLAVATRSRETILVASVGLCFAFALLAKRFGYSVALGAFVAGSLIAASGMTRLLQPLVRPLADVFAAIFFVSVGMLIEPGLIARHAGPIAVLVVAIPLGKIVFTGLGGLLVGRGLQPSLQAGMRLVPTGEFAFVVAAAAAPLGRGREELYAVFGAVCVGTIVLSPLFARFAVPISTSVVRRMPSSVETFETLHASWVAKLRSQGHGALPGALRIFGWLVADALVLIALVIGTSTALPRLAELLRGVTGGRVTLARWLVVGLAALACTPFATGIVRQARRLARLVAESLFPRRAAGAHDPAAAPRRALMVALHVAVLGAAGLPILAALQPFLPSSSGAGALVLGLLVVGFVFWRSIADLQGHVRAGSQVVAEVLARQNEREEPHDLDLVNELLPGLGNLTPVRVGRGSTAAGRLLSELDIHGRTAATVVCLSRGDQGVVTPDGDARLLAGDVLALAGTLEAIQAASELLRDPEEATTGAP
jgi:monovalent cation:H+ antiporter-2, CPA2 family